MASGQVPVRADWVASYMMSHAPLTSAQTQAFFTVPYKVRTAFTNSIPSGPYITDMTLAEVKAISDLFRAKGCVAEVNTHGVFAGAPHL